MGEEGKKPEEAKTEQKPAAEEPKKLEAAPAEKKEEKKDEAKKDEKKGDEAAKDEKEPPPPPPPTEVVLRVFMHCEGCAKKVRRCLKGFDGVEDVITDCKSSKVVVKGEKAAADPLKVLNRVQRKSHRQVELISPIPKPPPTEEEMPKEEENPKPEEKKEEPKVIIAVLKVHMHCEACAQGIKKRIQRMKGVESAEPDLKKSEVVVKGVFEPAKLVEYLYKRTGKQAAIVKEEAAIVKKEGDEKPKEEEKPKDEEKKGEEEGGKEKKEEGEEAKKEGGTEEEVKGMEVEVRKNEYNYQYYPPPRYGMELYAYPPQIFSDENPNACCVM